MPGEWVRTEVAGKPVDVFDPPGGRFAVLFLHDEDGAPPPAELTAALEAHNLRGVAPHGGRAWWVDRVCPEFDPVLTAEQHLLRTVAPWAESRWGLPPRAVALCGVGMGGQGAVRLGFKYPERFPVVASLNGAFDFHERHGHGTPLDEMYDSRERCRQDTAILHVDGHKWPPHVWFGCAPAARAWHRGNDRLREKLRAVGVPHTADLDAPDAGGLVARMTAFVAAGLGREGRRLA